MNKDRLKREIIRAVTEVGAAERPSQEWLVPLGEREPDKRNHFVLFMKPELLAVREGVKLGPILDLIGAVLRTYGVETGAIRVLNGPYLARHKIMEEHYGVINRASRLGRSALSLPTRQKLEAECPGIGTLKRTGTSGANSIRFSGRIGKRAPNGSSRSSSSTEKRSIRRSPPARMVRPSRKSRSASW